MKNLSTSLLHTAWTEEEKKQLDQLIAFVENYAADYFIFDACRHLQSLIEVDYLVLGCHHPSESQVFTILVLHQGKIISNFRYQYRDMPCAQVIGQDLYYVPWGLQSVYPNSEFIRERAGESYLGMPLFNNLDQSLGILFLLHSKIIERGGYVEALLNVIVPRLELELFVMQTQASKLFSGSFPLNLK